jgi:hypothetical protein
MKTLVVLFVVLFCMAVGNANAQSVSEKYYKNGTFWYECDGVWDAISGPITYHWVTKYDKYGKVSWLKLKMQSSELVSEATHEVFRMSDAQKQDAWGMPGSEMTWHFNLIGDKGTHVIVWVTVDISDGWMNFTDYKVKCL